MNMANNKPWLKKNEERTIEVMGAKVTLKKMSFGDSRKAINDSMNIDMNTGKAKVDASLVGVLRALYQIQDWELTDENDNKLPITLDTLDNILDEEFVGELVQKITAQDNNQVDPNEKK
jgi:P2-related tail formation protein